MVEIRPAEQRDTEAFAVLMEDLDLFYGATDTEPLDQRVRQIAENLFENPAAAYVLLAWENGKPIDMAAYSFLWPAAGVTRSLAFYGRLGVPKNQEKIFYRLEGAGLQQMATPHSR
ncbi:MAG: hypothetical protein ACRDQ4_00055 [Pseudonocardiaceae bacterium]